MLIVAVLLCSPIHHSLAEKTWSAKADPRRCAFSELEAREEESRPPPPDWPYSSESPEERMAAIQRATAAAMRAIWRLGFDSNIHVVADCLLHYSRGEQCLLGRGLYFPSVRVPYWHGSWEQAGAAYRYMVPTDAPLIANGKVVDFSGPPPELKPKDVRILSDPWVQGPLCYNGKKYNGHQIADAPRSLERDHMGRVLYRGPFFFLSVRYSEGSELGLDYAWEHTSADYIERPVRTSGNRDLDRKMHDELYHIHRFTNRMSLPGKKDFYFTERFQTDLIVFPEVFVNQELWLPGMGRWAKDEHEAIVAVVLHELAHVEADIGNLSKLREWTNKYDLPSSYGRKLREKHLDSEVAAWAWVRSAMSAPN